MSEQLTAERLESPEANLDLVIEKAAGQTLELIDQRYGPEKGNDDELAFHYSSHTRDVIRRAGIIADALLETGDITVREAALARLAAVFHDTIQNYSVTQDPDNPV